MADDSQEISGFFSRTGRMQGPIHRVNVDFTTSMLKELDSAAQELNISRQAVIKTLLRPGLDRRMWINARVQKSA
jgi:metal-responsive CopG/Arc/MetJ family transcriptional regulator